MKKQKNPMLHKGLLFISALLIGTFFIACGKDDDGGGPTTPTADTYTLNLLSGNNQTGEVEKALGSMIQVRLVNQENAPKSGVQVDFTQTVGGDFQGGDITDSEGIAEVEWTLGSEKGAQKLQAKVDDGVITTNSVDITATAKFRDCIEEEKSFTPSAITYIPPHTAGDQEYNGHGPNVDASVQIYIEGGSIKAKIYMKAKETQSDWTTAEGELVQTIYTAPSNRTIEEILSPTSADKSYTDTDHENDSFSLGTGGLVNKFVFTGDVSGADAGVKTKVVVTFNAVKVKLKEIGDCE